MTFNENQAPTLLPRLALKLPATLWIKGYDTNEQVCVELVFNQKNDKVFFTFPESDHQIELGIDFTSLERSLKWLQCYSDLTMDDPLLVPDVDKVISE